MVVRFWRWLDGGIVRRRRFRRLPVFQGSLMRMTFMAVRFSFAGGKGLHAESVAVDEGPAEVARNTKKREA